MRQWRNARDVPGFCSSSPPSKLRGEAWRVCARVFRAMRQKCNEVAHRSGWEHDHGAAVHGHGHRVRVGVGVSGWGCSAWWRCHPHQGMGTGMRAVAKSTRVPASSTPTQRLCLHP